MKHMIKVTTRRSNSIVRKGETVEIEWTPTVEKLIDNGRLIALTPPPDPDRTLSKDELLAEAEARGVYVAKSWAKDRIVEALEAAETEESE